MDWLVILIRLAITLTFLILAVFGPIALRQLNTFIRTYRTAHQNLENRVALLEQWRKQTENEL